MDRDNLPHFGPPEETETAQPDHLRSPHSGTETIDLSSLLKREVTDSGSFNLGNDIWASTFGKVLQVIPVPVLLIDEAGKVILANRSCIKLGIGYETMLNQPFSQFFTNSSVAAMCDSIIESVLSTRRSKTWEAALAVDAHTIWGRVTLRSVRVQGRRFLLALVEDLSLEKKQRLQEQRYSEELEKQVQKRTAELTALNHQLLAEVAERKRSELAVKESERRFRALFEQAAIGVAQVETASGRFMKVNKRLAEITGYSREELEKLTVSDITHPEDLAASLDNMVRLTRGEIRHFSLEKRYFRKDGSAVWVNFTGSPMWQPGDRPDCHIAVLEDISERKKAEQALRESEGRFRAIFESDHAVLLVLDPDTGTIEDASPGACAFYGFTREELRTKKIFEINILAREEILSKMQETKNQGSRYFDFHHRLASGELRDIEVYSGPIKIEGRTLLFSIVHDITEQKRAREASLQSERKYRALFDESKDGVYSVLRNGEIADVNPAFLEMFGFPRDEMIGKNMSELYTDPYALTKFQREIEHTGFVKDYEVGFRKKDGTEICCLMTSSLQLGNEGSLEGYRGIIRDLTSRKQLQRQLFQAQKMEAIGTLAGGIAHDFNNLLTIILGFSELLLMGKEEDDPAYGDLQKIRHSARSGADLINRILTFSRKTETNPRPLNLNREIEHVKKMLIRTIPKMIEIEVDLSHDLDRVNADPTQIEQILMNLAVNAKDAMPEGGKLTISTRNRVLDEHYCRMNLGVKPGNYTLLTVADTGEGMSTETLQHMFEPFYTTKGTGRGTGLGLAMVYGIVEQHGGHITCSSEIGTGTTFDIYLPAIAREADEEAHKTKPTLAHGTETLLLVDDEDFIRDLGRRILERSGYRVLVAANGKEALVLYRKEHDRIALVILDLIMPEMGGRQCLAELLQIDPQVKVIIASGYLAEAHAGELATAAKAVVSKPYDITQLLRAVREALDGEAS